MQRADEYLVRFEGIRALLAYEDALAVDARDGEAAAGRVRALWLLRRYRAAHYHLQEILAGFPRWPHTHVAAGYLSLGQRDDPIFLGVLNGSSHHDTNEARSAFDEALRLDPGCVLAWRGLTAAARLDGDLNGALALLAKAETEVGDESGFFLERAMCARDDGRLVDGLAHLRQAALLAPDCIEGKIIEAHVLIELGHPLQAARVSDTLLSAGLDCAPVYRIAALAYDGLAFMMPDRSSRVEPRTFRDNCINAACKDVAAGPPEVEIAIRQAYQTSEMALDAFERVLEGEPHSPLLRIGFAELYRLRGQRDAAVEQARLACMADKVHVPARVAQAYALFKADSALEATALAQDLASRYPQLRLIQQLMEDIDHQNGEFEGALKYAIVAWQSTPDHLESLKRVSLELISLWDIAGAENKLHAGIEQWPGDPELRALCVMCMLAERRRHEALSQLKEARSVADQSDVVNQLFRNTRGWLARHPISWLMGRIIDAGAMRRLEATANIRDMRREHIPDSGHTRITGLLRQLDWDAARSHTLANWLGEFITTVLIVGVCIFGLILPYMILQLGDLTKNTWYWTGWDALIIVPTAALLWTRGFKVRLGLACAAAIVTTIYIALVRFVPHWRYAKSSILISDVVVDLTVVTFIFSSIGLLLAMRGFMQRIWEGRALHRRPVAAMISSLLELSGSLTKDMLTDTQMRIHCMQLIEQTARSQEHALNEALGGGTGRADPTIAEQTARWATRTAAATRRLKEHILAPGAETANSLNEQVKKLLDIACRQHWGELEQADPPRRRQRAFGWLILAARTFVIAVIPIAALGIYQLWIRPLHPESLPEPSDWTTIVIGIIWPVTTVLWRLDPDIPDKVGVITGLFKGPASTGSANRARTTKR